MKNEQIFTFMRCLENSTNLQSDVWQEVASSQFPEDCKKKTMVFFSLPCDIDWWLYHFESKTLLMKLPTEINLIK